MTATDRAPDSYSLGEGELAVRLARSAVGRAIRAPGTVELPAPLPPSFSERRGVFVSWYAHPGHLLRGCVGFPRAVLPLAEGVAEAAVSAALADPRFPPVGPEELAGLVAEVSLLSAASPLALADRPRAVRVGVDGLEVERGRHRGLLLPQVAPEQGWGPLEFLDGACEKAGLAPGAWRSPDVLVRCFQAEVFRETSPSGPVVRLTPGPRRRAG